MKSCPNFWVCRQARRRARVRVAYELAHIGLFLAAVSSLLWLGVR